MSEEQKNPKGGPRTPEGRAKSSGNSLKHGLASGHILIAGEDPEAFESLVDQLTEDYDPETATEVVLVHNMAKFHWLENRAIRLQQKAFEDPEKIDTKYLELMMRYQNTNHRAFNNALKTLLATQKERVRVHKEFVSQDGNVNYKLVFDSDPNWSDSDDYDMPQTEEFDEDRREFRRPPGLLA